MKSVEYTRRFLEDMLSEKFGLDKLIISKSLREFYKNPQTSAHKVLADRMGKRDPGTKPSVGSRVPFVYIQKKGKVKLQGDRIESPAYIKKHIIEHDMDVALRVAESVTMMHNGRIFKEGKPAEIEEDPEVQALYLGGGDG